MENQNKYLLLARSAREEDNAEDAKKYYDMVRTEDPTNAEAKFFYSYYYMYCGKKGEATHNYLTLCKGIESTLKMIIASEDTVEEKKNLVRTILNCTMNAYNTAESINSELSEGRILEIQEAYIKAEEAAIKMYTDKLGEDVEFAKILFNIRLSKPFANRGVAYARWGDEIERKWSSDSELMAKAIDFWKKDVRCMSDEDKAKYVAKIQKYEPTYVAPVPEESFLDKLIKKITALIGKK